MVAGTIGSEPGLAVSSLGPAPARPVIRGLDGDRVLILQDGQRTGDLSSQSGDHGVVVKPAGAQRIEVVRGPATLLYGANAIGGLVNVITDEIPTVPERGVRGNVLVDLGTGATEFAKEAMAGDFGKGQGTRRFLWTESPRVLANHGATLDRVWDEDSFAEPSTVTVHIRRIREKLEVDPSRPRYLRTVWGVGYKCEPN